MENTRTGSVCASSEWTEIDTEEKYAMRFQYIPLVSVFVLDFFFK